MGAVDGGEGPGPVRQVTVQQAALPSPGLSRFSSWAAKRGQGSPARAGVGFLEEGGLLWNGLSDNERNVFLTGPDGEGGVAVLPAFAWACAMGGWAFAMDLPEGWADDRGGVRGSSRFMVVLDEFGYYAAGGMAQAVSSMMRQGRKSSGSRLSVTQTLSDFRSSGFLMASGEGAVNRWPSTGVAALLKVASSMGVGELVSGGAPGRVPVSRMRALCMLAETLGTDGAASFLRHWISIGRSGAAFEWLCALSSTGCRDCSALLSETVCDLEGGARAFAEEVLMGAGLRNPADSEASSI